MIWSATITETAIVISACRSSWPWFQRRNACCMTKPMIAMHGAATSSGTSHSQVFTWLDWSENPWPVMPCCTSYAM